MQMKSWKDIWPEYRDLNLNWVQFHARMTAELIMAHCPAVDSVKQYEIVSFTHITSFVKQNLIPRNVGRKVRE